MWSCMLKPVCGLWSECVRVPSILPPLFLPRTLIESNMLAGAQQGCALSGCLFILYTNDWHSSSDSIKHIRFSDDSSIVNCLGSHSMKLKLKPFQLVYGKLAPTECLQKQRIGYWLQAFSFPAPVTYLKWPGSGKNWCEVPGCYHWLQFMLQCPC